MPFIGPDAYRESAHGQIVDVHQRYFLAFVFGQHHGVLICRANSRPFAPNCRGCHAIDGNIAMAAAITFIISHCRASWCSAPIITHIWPPDK